jgi:NAD(P)-dependent dehydrogenase (short-subunit alcohol dehydrogenase family)
MTSVAMITGGHQGLGLAIAEALARAEFQIVIVADAPEDAPSVEHALSRLDDTARYLRHDFAASADPLVERIEAEIGPLTTFVSGADVTARLPADLLEISADVFDHAIAVSLRGAFFLAQAAARAMAGRSSKHYRSMTFVTSVSAEMASPDRAESSIAKAGVSMVVKAFATRMAPLGVGVFELRPGLIDATISPGLRERYSTRIEHGLVPAARWGQVQDVASVILPIATGQLGFATGTVIPIDGGLSIPRL